MNISCSNQDPCPVILDSKCVIYEGENLLFIGVNTNDNYRYALQQINAKMADLILSGGITELRGDVLAIGPGEVTATLATVNGTPGQFGSSTAIPKVTVDAKGRVTAISTDPVFIPSGALNFIGDVTGSGNTGSNTTLTLATVNSNVYTTNNFLKFAVNAKGLITSATPVTSSDIITTLGYTPYNSTNPAGYISGITGPMVTTALGYTPYNSTNPAGYISGINSSMVISALGYTPYNATNPSNYISRLGLSASGPLSYDNVTGNFSIQLADSTNAGYLSAADWNTFNNKQAAGNYITGLTGEATATGPGIVNVTLNNAAVTGKVLTGLNLTPGGSILDTDSILAAFGKLQNQLSALLGGVSYQGVWDASTNVPTIVSNVGTKGHYYIVSVAGTTDINGISDWKVGDWIIFNGAAWDKVDNTDAVSSVNGFTGAVSLTTDNIPEGLTNQYFTPSRARLALSGGNGISYDNVTGIISSTITQYTDAMARSAISAGTGISYDSVSGVITNSAPDQTVSLTGSTGIGTSGTYPNFTITNTAPDQTVGISSGAGINVTGTYPNFTIASTITQYTDALARQAISLTTTGSSGAATYNNVTGVLNIPIYTTDLSGYVPITRTLTINGTTYDLSADRSWTISGSMPTGGAAGQILAKIDGTDYNTEWIDNYSTQVKNTVKLGAALTKGTPVYVSSADGTNMIVSAASNTSEATSSKTFGLLETGGALNAQVKVVTYGLLAGLDTSAANAAGDPVWLGPGGTLLYGLANKPYAPLHMVYIGVVTRKQSNNGEIFINVQNGFEMDELHNVSAQNPNNNAILAYNTTTSLWEKNTIVGTLGYTPYNATNPSGYITGITSGMVTTALGYTPVTNARTLTINGTTYDLSADRSWTISTGGVTSFNTRTGAITLVSTDVTSALGFSPYNATNPAGYITGITSANVTSALGYTPYNSTNPSGYITSAALTQLVSPNGATVVAADSAMPNAGQSFIHTLALGPGGNDGHTLGMTWANTTSVYGAQIWVDTDPTNTMAFRSRSSAGVWTGWNTIIHSGNIGSQSVNYASSAGSVAWSNVSGRPTALSQFTNDSGFITSGGRAYPRMVGGGDLNFNWSGQSGQPTWLWGGTDGTNMYVYNPSNFSVSYASSAGSASSASYATYLPTAYAGGVQGNPQVYFNNGIGVKVAMTGSWSTWSDTLWINGYSGGDVPNMCALHFLRNGTPRMAISTQSFSSGSYGTYYEVITAYNIASQSVSSASSATNSTSANNAYGLYTNASADNIYNSGWFRNYGDSGLYQQSYGGHLRRNVSSSYGIWEAFGYTKGGYAGLNLQDPQGYNNNLMFENGNGGIYVENGNGWSYYYSRGNNCIGLGSSNTYNWVRTVVNGKLKVESDSIHTGWAYFDANVQFSGGNTQYHETNYYYTWRNWGGWGGEWINRNGGDMIMNLYALYAVTGSVSDIRYKKDVSALSYGLNEIMQLNPIKYHYNLPKESMIANDPDFFLGFSAQEVQGIIPEAVHEKMGSDNKDGMLAITYDELIPVLVNGMKEQQVMIHNQSIKINKLEILLNQLLNN